MGRWAKPNKIPLENRKCRSCDVLEDEFHFILQCSRYQDLREIYIKRYFWRRPNMLKLIELFTTENSNILRHLSEFITKAFERRGQTGFI